MERGDCLFRQSFAHGRNQAISSLREMILRGWLPTSNQTASEPPTPAPLPFIRLQVSPLCGGGVEVYLHQSTPHPLSSNVSTLYARVIPRAAFSRTECSREGPASVKRERLARIHTHTETTDPSRQVLPQSGRQIPGRRVKGSAILDLPSFGERESSPDIVWPKRVCERLQTCIPRTSRFPFQPKRSG